MKRATRLNLSLEGSLNSLIERSRARLVFFLLAVFIVYGAIAVKVIKLTFFFDHENKNSLNYTPTITQGKDRLSFFDRNGILITSNLKTNSLFADARDSKNPAIEAKMIRKVLPDLNEKELAGKLASKKAFVWIKRNLHPKEMQDINDLGIPALHFQGEEKRIYPHQNVFSHVIGMVGRDNQGLTGLEKYLDNLDKVSFEKLALDERLDVALDMRIQSLLHSEMSKQLKKHSALGAAGIVMDVTTGEILALVSLPDYDPNTPQTLTQNNQFNNVTLGVYELGSTFKPITFATAFEKKLIDLRTVIDATEPIRIGRFRISDFHAKKRPMTAAEVMMYSSNIGTAKIAEKIGNTTLQEYFRKLGLYEKVKTEIAERALPLMPTRWTDVTTLTASFGHGVAVTPLHIASATAALVNGGMLYTPSLIKLSEGKKPVGTRIFSEQTSETMRKLFRLVVSKGTGSSADVKGYYVGGKTGTAEKLVNGRYVEGKVISSFMGIFPMYKPKYFVMAIFDEPKATPDTYGYNTGGWIAAPVVSRVIAAMGPLMKIKPVDENDEALQKRFFIDYEL